jgi:hypothetical protein
MWNIIHLISYLKQIYKSVAFFEIGGGNKEKVKHTQF